MNKSDAEKLARFLGLEATQSGGNVYTVTLKLQNGMTLILGEDGWTVETEEDVFSATEIINEWEG